VDGRDEASASVSQENRHAVGHEHGDRTRRIGGDDGIRFDRLGPRIPIDGSRHLWRHHMHRATVNLPEDDEIGVVDAHRGGETPAVVIGAIAAERPLAGCKPMSRHAFE
jgi:hypothetical protein